MAKGEDWDYSDKFSFLGEWYDYDSSLHKKFLILFFPSDSTIELFDRELNRVYLRRAPFEGVTLEKMYVGNTIRIYGRQITITDYADGRTKKIIGKAKEHTFAILKPTAVQKLGQVVTEIEQRQFEIIRLKMCNVSRKDALSFYESKKGDSFLPFMVEHLVSGPIVALEIVGDNALQRWKDVLGPTDPIEARKTHPETLRARYGMERASNGFHASDSYELAVREACFFFPQGLGQQPPPSTAQITNCTCCVIKPHAVDEKKVGFIISAITNNPKFKVTAMQMFYLSNANADEFLEVYKGVVADFHALLSSFLDGPCIALEIAGKEDDLDVHGEFRKFCGPTDSDIAKQIRPNSLRAMFGVDKYKNAVHCTDLKEDTALELEYFFKILN
ncbi:nucleoside diphosphate kinase 7 [Agrilus planipennis]|uniref:Nucleoside diphosphate kinase 7 n=1 Tax=Agrilus planipennis TaxID=224129 RepID=A0A1W4XQP3_AGRPL|nr:nucleoside diphosphate kinase 7 [Agrilus planipennis]XP_018335092.1 nucleoside diphosphate kinase 7 [Agrilus planipennis]